jgi:uncharacterized protein YneF (UPF0154 family)
MRRVRSVTCKVHPSLYSKMEELRTMYEKQMGQKLSQVQVTNILSKRVRIPNKIDIIGGFNGKIIKKKR